MYRTYVSGRKLWDESVFHSGGGISSPYGGLGYLVSKEKGNLLSYRVLKNKWFDYIIWIGDTFVYLFLSKICIEVPTNIGSRYQRDS